MPMDERILASQSISAQWYCYPNFDNPCCGVYAEYSNWALKWFHDQNNDNFLKKITKCIQWLKIL